MSASKHSSATASAAEQVAAPLWGASWALRPHTC